MITFLMIALAFALLIVLSMAQKTSPQPPAQAPFKAFNVCQLASFTIGAKAGNVINAAVQLKDARNQNVAKYCNVFCYLASSTDGGTISTVSPTSTTAIGTNGQILGAHTNTTAYDVLSNITGQFDLNITQTAGGTTYYLVVCMPDGSIAVSSAISF